MYVWRFIFVVHVIGDLEELMVRWEPLSQSIFTFLVVHSTYIDVLSLAILMDDGLLGT